MDQLRFPAASLAVRMFALVGALATPIVAAAQTTSDALSQPPANAQHWLLQSAAGKHPRFIALLKRLGLEGDQTARCR